MSLWMDSPWRTSTFSIQGSDISEASIVWDSAWGDTVELTLRGESARALLSGSSSEIVSEDADLVFERQNAIEAHMRAAAAEAQIANLRDEIEDYIGEIDLLRTELAEERRAKAKSPLSGSAFYSEPWHVTYTPSYAEVSRLADKILKGLP